MEANAHVVSRGLPRTVAAPLRNAPTVAQYYAETTADYRVWSERLNMHFGYWRPGLSLLDREGMLDEMTRQVLARLERGGQRLRRLVDLGCGAGAPAALVLGARPDLRLDGITLASGQVALAEAAARRAGADQRARFQVADYTASGLPADAFDGAMAIESACHCPGRDKAAFVREAARLLAPGGRLVVADGFLKRRSRPPGPLARRAVDAVARNWAVPGFAEIEAFTAALAASGFVDIVVEEISWNLVPSVLHIPLVSARFLARELARSRLRLGRVRFGHVLASLLAPLVGLMRRRFGYFLVSARKP
jgi:cyclopropane fatty-acyl-phospholipid synthase-like methyltransferase